jgi:hypothetical protein
LFRRVFANASWAPVRLAMLLLLAPGPSIADESARVCYNYGCNAEATVMFPESRIEQYGALLEIAADEPAEREALGLVIGRMHAFAGGQSPIWSDRGGDSDDDEVDGRMDCLDHSVTTSNFIALLERRGLLRFHALMPPSQRGMIWQHWSARVASKASEREYMVDSWFYDNGRPAVVMERDTWMAGADPRRRRWAINDR